MKKTLYLFLLLGTTVLFTGCLFNGDEEEPLPRWQTNGKPTYFLDDTIKAYTVFPIGSWWVYEDSATGKKDTIKLTSSTTEISVSSKSHFNGEVTSMLFSSSSHLFTISANSAVSPHFIEENKQIGFYNETVVNSTSPRGGTLFFTGLDSLKIFNSKTGQDEYIIKDFIDSFNSSCQISYPFEKSAYTPKINHFASGVGQVRKEYFDGSVWNLIDYHIAE